MDRLLPVLEQPLLQKTKGQKKNTVANLHDCTKAWKKQTQTQTIRCKVQLIIAWLLKLKLNYSTSPHYFHIMLQIGVLPLDQFPPPLPPLAFQQVIPTICFIFSPDWKDTLQKESIFSKNNDLSKAWSMTFSCREQCN